MTMAWDLQLPATKKLVLLAMCDWANDMGCCFPSMSTVARKTCISKRQCQRVMSEFVADGLIAVTGNQQGGIGSRRYQINVNALRQSAPGATGDKLTPVANVSPGPVTASPKTDDTDVTRTSTNRQSDPTQRRARGDALDWTYLSQLQDHEQVVVVEMLKGLEATQHQDILDELAGALRAKAIKTQWPAWLRGLIQRARTGAFVPSHALTIQRDFQRVVREAADAEKRRAEAQRRSDPAVRARSLEAMAAAIAALGPSADRA